MAERVYVRPVGDDLIDAPGNGWQIAGVIIDNPSGSWLHVGGAINKHVAPYTLGRSIPINPTQLTVSVRFTDSPSGTPSKLVDGPVTIRLVDTPVPASPGSSSGAEEFQTPGKGDIQYRFDGFAVTEGLTFPVTITPSVGSRLVLLKWRVQVQIAIRTVVSISMTDASLAWPTGLLFPDAVVSPEAPDSGYLPAVGRVLAPNATAHIGGIVSPGGGWVALSSYLEFYSVGP